MMMAKAALPLLLAAAVAATAVAATPVAWVAESEEYVSLLRAKLTTPWDVKWCGANGSACVAGSDPSSAAVKAIVGRPVAVEGVDRPTTSAPVIYRPADADLSELTGGLPGAPPEVVTYHPAGGGGAGSFWRGGK